MDSIHSLPPSLLHTHTHTHSVVGLWREDLSQTNPKAAQSLADPTEYENLFPELKQALVAEQVLKQEREALRPASDFTVLQVEPLVDFMRQRSKEPAIDTIAFLIFLRLLQSVMFWRRWHKGCLLHLRRRRWRRRRDRSNPHHSRMMM